MSEPSILMSETSPCPGVGSGESLCARRVGGGLLSAAALLSGARGGSFLPLPPHGFDPLLPCLPPKTTPPEALMLALDCAAFDAARPTATSNRERSLPREQVRDVPCLWGVSAYWRRDSTGERRRGGRRRRGRDAVLEPERGDPTSSKKVPEEFLLSDDASAALTPKTKTGTKVNNGMLVPRRQAVISRRRTFVLNDAAVWRRKVCVFVSVLLKFNSTTATTLVDFPIFSDFRGG